MGISFEVQFVFRFHCLVCVHTIYYWTAEAGQRGVIRANPPPRPFGFAGGSNRDDVKVEKVRFVSSC